MKLAIGNSAWFPLPDAACPSLPLTPVSAALSAPLRVGAPVSVFCLCLCGSLGLCWCVAFVSVFAFAFAVVLVVVFLLGLVCPCFCACLCLCLCLFFLSASVHVCFCAFLFLFLLVFVLVVVVVSVPVSVGCVCVCWRLSLSLWLCLCLCWLFISFAVTMPIFIICENNQFPDNFRKKKWQIFCFAPAPFSDLNTLVLHGASLFLFALLAAPLDNVESLVWYVFPVLCEHL